MEFDVKSRGADSVGELLSTSTVEGASASRSPSASGLTL